MFSPVCPPPPANRIDVDLNIAEGVFKCFQQNLENFTDFTVNVGNTKFQCHKFVLSSCSGFFEALMRTDMKEKSESSCTIEGISPEIFGLILDSIYTGNNVLNVENMFEIWHASNQLQIKFLVTACEDFVKMNINVHNFYRAYEEAKLLDSHEVVLKVKQLIVTKFTRIANSNVFMRITGEDLVDIFKYIRFIGVGSDYAVDLILRWTCSEDSYLTSEPDKSAPPHTVEALTDLQNAECRTANAGTFGEDDVELRRSYLGLLLAVIPLQEISNECLTKLMNNRFVMANLDAISIVNEIAVTRVGCTKTNSSDTKAESVRSDFDIILEGSGFILTLLVISAFFCIFLAIVYEKLSRMSLY
ncbi:kelch-like protein 40 [Physella acuta]|uniref:kelch-like protein 40 n=1 Tax=Physella acuta TaxID=109671 RepID=UPI0027DB3BE6|nr:kelch-like protein 40 [Physella acuta]